jgi:hypothetical protein
MTAFTPPTDAWIIRHPSSQAKKELQQAKEENKSKKAPKVPAAHQLEQSCKSYIDTSEIPVKSSKSLGTDDHFKSMVCSKNLLKVCEKLMTHKDISKESNISTYEDDDEFELSLMDENGRKEFYRNKYGNRRNSQSLPASPKLDRKNKSDMTSAAHNPYFTITKSSESTRPESSISFLTNLFGITAKKPSEAQASLAQKNEAVASAFEKTDQKPFSSGEPTTSKSDDDKRKMTPRPHQFREMNFWSPTSM